MNPYPNFTALHGPGRQYRSSGEALRKFEGLLPIELLKFWASQGFSSYCGGLLWVTDPTDFEHVLEEWMDISKAPLVFARTAWGGLYFWEDGMAKVLHVWTGKVVKMTSEISLLFESSFTTESYLEKALAASLFRDILKRLGPLGPDECYGFVPAIQLGGELQQASAHKVKLKEHLSILSQL